tara:strand:- start:65 stop:649 length:585 start_codon:yes stop_codon:yes gene_type:complete
MVKNNKGTYCNSDHMYEDIKHVIPKLIAKGRIDERKMARAGVLKLKRETLSWQESQTQDAFNKMRKAEEMLWFMNHGLEPTCISCGKPIGNDVWACGHFKTQGGNSRLRYDRANTYLQHNRRCNSDLSGDIYGTSTTHGYLAGLKIRFGSYEGQQIIDYCEANTHPIKRTCEELQQMRKEFNQCYRDTIKLINN